MQVVGGILWPYHCIWSLDTVLAYVLLLVGDIVEDERRHDVLLHSPRARMGEAGQAESDLGVI